MHCIDSTSWQDFEVNRWDGCYGLRRDECTGCTKSQTRQGSSSPQSSNSDIHCRKKFPAVGEPSPAAVLKGMQPTYKTGANQSKLNWSSTPMIESKFACRSNIFRTRANRMLYTVRVIMSIGTLTRELVHHFGVVDAATLPRHSFACFRNSG